MIYASAAVKLFSEEELVELLAKSRANNAPLGVTGMLLYRDGNFMQALEGEESSVRDLFEKISRDARHKSVSIIHEASVDERQFPDWSMGFRDLNSPDVLSLPGYSEFLNKSFTGIEFTANPSIGQKLLLMFKKHME
jgi:hypothetical protein